MKPRILILFCLSILLTFAVSGCSFLFTESLPSEQVAVVVSSEEHNEESISIPEPVKIQEATEIPKSAKEDFPREKKTASLSAQEELPPEETFVESPGEEYIAQAEPESAPTSEPQDQPSHPAAQPTPATPESSAPEPASPALSTPAPVTPEPTTPAPAPAPSAPSTPSRCKEHDLVYTEPVPATCTEYGECHWYCKNCDFTFDAPLSPTGHDWDNGTITTPATCGSAGVKTFTCGNCQLTRTETIAAQGDHNYVATATVAQTKIGTMDDLGYTVYTCTVCNATMNSDYEGYLDCAWRYQKVNEFRTGPERFLLLEDGSKVYFNIEGCTQLEPFTRAEGLESIAMLRAKQEAYDISNGERLNHEHDGLPCFYYYGHDYFYGFNCECCQYGGNGLDATFKEEERAPYDHQGHLRIGLSPSLKYIGLAAYVKDGGVVVVCEYSDVPN